MVEIAENTGETRNLKLPKLEIREAWVSQQYFDGKVLTREETQQIPLQIVRLEHPEIPQAEVTYELGTTRNLGNYESVRIAVGVRLPTSVEGISAAYEAAKKFVDERVGKFNSEVAGLK